MKLQETPQAFEYCYPTSAGAAIWVPPTKHGVLDPAITLPRARTASDLEVPSGLDFEFDFSDRRTGITYRNVTVHVDNGEWGELDFGSMEQQLTFEPAIATAFREAVLDALMAWVRHFYGRMQSSNTLLRDYEKIQRELEAGC